MPTRSNHNHFGLHGTRGELVELVRKIQALTLEVRERRENGEATAELEDRERTIEQLRWRLATVARRTATNDLGAAA